MNFRRIAELKLDFLTVYEGAAKAIHNFLKVLAKALDKEPAIDGNEIQPVRESELADQIVIDLKEAYVNALEKLNTLIALPIDSPIKSSAEASHGDVSRINHSTRQMIADLQLIAMSIQSLTENSEKNAIRQFFNVLLQKAKEVDNHLRRRNENEGQAHLETIFKDKKQQQLNIDSISGKILDL
jgi:hypothetical protein